MNKSFKFASKLSSDILVAGLADAIASALSGNGRTIDTEAIKIATSGQELEGFGKNILEGQSPALISGMSYVIVGCVQVPESVNNRGVKISGYDGVALRDEKGQVHVVALTSLFNPWQPLLDAKGKVLDLEELSEGLKAQYADAPDQYTKMSTFVKKNNTTDIANSFESGFTLQTPFAERFAKLADSVIKIEDAQEARVTLTLTDRAGAGMAGEKRPAVVRAYAISADSSDKAIKAFEASVKANTKK